MTSPSSVSYPTLTPRQKAREIAFQFLYRLSIDNLDKKNEFPPVAELEKDFEKHSAHFKTPEISIEYAQRLIRTTVTCITEIDQMITKHAENWRLDRISAVDKAFLRMGVAELLYFKDVPASVTLNEVVELSKYFGEADTSAFLNGLLDPISKEPIAVAGKVPSE